MLIKATHLHLDLPQLVIVGMVVVDAVMDMFVNVVVDGMVVVVAVESDVVVGMAVVKAAVVGVAVADDVVLGNVVAITEAMIP